MLFVSRDSGEKSSRISVEGRCRPVGEIRETLVVGCFRTSTTRLHVTDDVPRLHQAKTYLLLKKAASMSSLRRCRLRCLLFSRPSARSRGSAQRRRLVPRINRTRPDEIGLLALSSPARSSRSSGRARTGRMQRRREAANVCVTPPARDRARASGRRACSRYRSSFSIEDDAAGSATTDTSHARRHRDRAHVRSPASRHPGRDARPFLLDILITQFVPQCFAARGGGAMPLARQAGRPPTTTARKLAFVDAKHRPVKLDAFGS